MRFLAALLLLIACVPLDMRAAIPIIFPKSGTNTYILPEETNEVGNFYTNMWIDAEDYNYSSGDTIAGGFFPSKPGTNFNATGTYAGLSATEGRDFQAWDALSATYRATTGVADNEHDDGHQPNGVPYTDYKVRAFNANGPDFLNYARIFSNSNYRVYGRVSSTVTFGIQLEVTTDGTWTNTYELQNRELVASINTNGSGTNTFFYAPFMTNGVIREIALNGTNGLTVTITNGICDIHRLMLVRWTGTPQGFANAEPDPDVVFVDENGTPFYDPEIQ